MRKPAAAKNSGTNRPSAALRMPGITARCTRRGIPDRAAPKSRAPMDPCSSMRSAATTIRKSPPMRRPNASSGTLKWRSRVMIAGGRTLADSTHASTVKPTMCVSRKSMPDRFGS